MKEGRLFLFVVPKLPLEIKTMKDYLQSIIKRKLPKHYSPDDIILVDGVPITKHGKLNSHIRLLIIITCNVVCNLKKIFLK